MYNINPSSLIFIGSSGDGGLATSALLSNNLLGLTFDSTFSFLYISDTGNCVIRRINMTSNIITVFAGIAGTCAYGVDNVVATSTGLNAPQGMLIIVTSSVHNIFYNLLF